jgi:hypothetical protein
VRVELAELLHQLQQTPISTAAASSSSLQQQNLHLSSARMPFYSFNSQTIYTVDSHRPT